MLHIPGLYIGHSEGRGRGVFTAHDLNENDIIEICPLIIVAPEQVRLIHKTILQEYYFLWPDPEDSACLALGYGSLYNHSFQPNAVVIYDIPAKEFEIQAIADIQAGSEIFIDYTDGTKGIVELWFEPV